VNGATGGTFRIEATFVITRHGLVLAGDVVSGRVYKDGRIALPDGAGGTRLERITAVEIVDRREDDGTMRGLVGLIVGELPPEEIVGLRAAITPGMVVAVEAPEPGREPPAPPPPEAPERRPWWRFWSGSRPST
jgi:hypothetical protein